MIHVALFGIEASLGALLTYLVHSTTWIVGALLLTRFDRALSPAARHVVWRAALIGPLASSTFALGLGHDWQWALMPASAAGEPWPAAAPYAATLRPLPLAGPVELVPDAPSRSVPFSAEATAPLPWFTLLAGCGAVVALIGVFLIARAALRQHRALAKRTRVTHPACIEALEQLAKRAGIRHPVRLSRCAAATTPLVLSAREICLPERALELERSALESVLAHELAHIERRDGLWLNGALFLQALLWFQPLHRKVRAELQESAELAADDRAVELTGDALGLARTLTDVASWASGAPLISSVAMARPGSAIVERVARLVESGDARHGARFGSRTPWFALAALTAIGACSPSVGAPQAERPGAASGSRNADAAHTPPLVPALSSNPAEQVETSARAPASVPAGDARNGDEREPLQHGTSDVSEPDPARELARHELRQRARGRRVARQHLASPRQGKPHAPPAAAADPAHGPKPHFPIQGVVSEVMASVVPRAIEFSNGVAQMAMAEHALELQIERAEDAAAEPNASARARAELARLKQELAASEQRRERLERDFEEHMETWSKGFEEKFQRDHASRFAAWGEEFGRRMAEMAREIELQLPELRQLSIPRPQPPSIPSPAALPSWPGSTPPRSNAPAQPHEPARPAAPPPANPPPAPAPLP
jgi:beta-lactamase regulating signal transducer with metallopeptidase domain